MRFEEFFDEIEGDKPTASEKKVLDKIESARSTYDKEVSLSFPKLMQDEAREDFNCISHGEAIMGLFADDVDGIMAMLMEIRNMLFPALKNGEEHSTPKSTPVDEDDYLPQEEEDNKESPHWEMETAEEFMRAWHHLEVQTAATWKSISEDDYSMVAMFREIGSATYEELSSGRNQLSLVLLKSMERAVSLAKNLRKDVALLTGEILNPEAKPEKTEPEKPKPPPVVVQAREVDLSMAGMFSLSEWTS